MDSARTVGQLRSEKVFYSLIFNMRPFMEEKIMMTQRLCRILSLVAGLLLLAQIAGTAWAQGGTRGTITVTVTDPSSLVVTGAKLTLVDVKTKDARSATSLENGTYSFTGLLGGTYELTVEKAGFATQKFDAVIVEAARTTDLNAKLQVGTSSSEIEVVAEASPLMESTASAIGTNFDVKQIEDLPMQGRDVSGLINYVPGAADGIFNGMRAASQTVTIDGVVAQSSRGKDNGNSTPANTARLENIDEIVVQTDQLDLNQGFGQANMQAGFTTRRGGDKYHGRVYADLQNSAFNAPGYWNAYNISKGASPNTVLAKNHLLEWGPSVGGPIPIPRYKGRLFFFFSYTQKTTPGNTTESNTFPNSSLQAGNYQYVGTDGSNHTVNLLTLAKSQGLPSAIDAKMATDFSMINTAAKLGTTKVDGSDPYNITDLAFNTPNSSTVYYPTFRIDYNATQNLRINLAFNETKSKAPDGAQTPPYPGSGFAAETGGQYSTNYTASLGIEWSISPQLLNQLRGGYLYTYGGSIPTTGTTHLLDDVVWWNSADGLNSGNSGLNHAGRTTTFYPLGSLSDNLVWQHRAHNVIVGVSWYREQDHYWDNPQGYKNVVMNDSVNGINLVQGDPAVNAFTSSTMPGASPSQLQNAQSLYGLVTGRLGAVQYTDAYDPSQKAFVPGKAVNLDEVQQAYGLFAQDSWRIKPSLTLNYGLRWDFTGDDHDLQGLYHTVSKEDLWGPTGYMNQFNPGSFKNPNPNPSFVAKTHAYNAWNVSPQPALGLAWSPSYPVGKLGKLLGPGKTVIRAGYALRRYTEAYQQFWQYASNSGSFYYNSTEALAQAPVGGQQSSGTYAPGTYSWSQENSIPTSAFKTNYTSYQSTITEESQALNGTNQGIAGMDENIRQPYIQSWNLGIQRELSKSNAIEIRYVGNHALKEWVPLNPNEVNIFENGFLQEFKQAQQNLTAYIATNPGCVAAGTCSFAYNGIANQVNLPIMTAAFGSDQTQWTNSSFLTNLQNGQVGSFANALTAASYLCNLVGNFTTPCQTNAGRTGTGVGPYPSNLFQANPYATNQTVGYLTSAGSSNYHSLQIEFREKNFHGANFTANYTFAKNLGVRPLRADAVFSLVTMRNMRLSSNPSDSDIRQTLNILGTYDLPFGKGRMFSTRNKILNAVAGDWTWGTITTFHTGLPFLLTGGNMTYNDFTDGGIVMNGVTLKQLRKSVGVYHNPTGNGAMYFINPKYLSPTYLQPNTTPGTLGARPWLWAPHVFNTDMSMSKTVQIREGIKFSLQGEFLNATNHTTWTTGITPTTPTPAQVNQMNAGFGVTSAASGGRVVEVRANIEF
jgi:hypothetical protein